ncbi:MAG TPA: sensor histidine kinase [Candidatus Acidoferrales bacterium]|nr:sensor histidine kinase [Candidatus Acidoferrales bacterium]
MRRSRIVRYRPGLPFSRSGWKSFSVPLYFALWLLAAWPVPVHAAILWSDPGSRVIHKTPYGNDILSGKLKRDDKASDALYFKFRVDPLSDPADEPYYALFQLVESNQMRLGVGNAWEAWGYSAAYTSETGPSNKPPSELTYNDGGEYNLQSSHPAAAGMGKFFPYELPSHDHPRTIVFKVQYIPGGDDLVTVWLDPNLTHGATAENQPEELTTKFKAKATFDEILLRHDGTGGLQHDGGNGWFFSDMAIATSFNDFVVVRFWQTWWFTTLLALFVLAAVGATVRMVERRKYQLQLQRAEQQHALEQERARIAQDLHDELGSTLTRLSLLSGLIRTDKDSPEQVEVHASKLAQSADQTVRALEEIVWAVRPGSDTLQSLTDYIAHFANELFDGNSTRCRLDLPHDLPATPLPPDVRHNIFLIVKEALTNALKHAGAGEVQVHANITGDRLEILVQDDGKGFNLSSSSENRRNGLGNMRRRAEAIGGELELQSAADKGTRVKLLVDLKGRKSHKMA